MLNVRRAALGLGLLLLPAACGSSESGNPVSDAARTVEAQGTARVTLLTTVGHQTSRASFAVDFDHGRARIAFPAADSSAPSEVRYIGDTIYARFGFRQWVRASSSHSSLAEIDPRTLLQNLGQGAHDVRDEGQAQVAGVPTRHYHLSVIANSSGIAAAKAGTMVPVEIWVDGAGLARLVRADYTASAGKPAHIEWRFSDFGAAVNVEPPPAAEVSEGPVGVTAG